MAVITINIPDNFHNEMLKRKYQQGASMRWQILTALRKDWEWEAEEMPVDARLHAQLQDPPASKTGGRTPKNVPLAPDGLPDFDAMLDHREQLAQAGEEQPPPPKRIEDKDEF